MLVNTTVPGRAEIEIPAETRGTPSKEKTRTMAGQRGGNPWLITGFLLVVFLAGWQLATLRTAFDPKGLTDEQLQLMEFNGDIVREADGTYRWNPEKEKVQGIPGPLAVLDKARVELSEAFVKKGTNDHGIGFLVFYTVARFGAGFLAASVVAIIVGVLLGLNKVLFRAVNPFIQILKPISPLAWMPLLLYTVKDPKWTAILVVFMAALWPTLATTAFGVNGLRKDYLHVAAILQLSWFKRLFTVILPGAAPTIVNGLRISFGSALVAVVPAEMLLGELGVGYLSWIEWNNLDISGVIFAILVVGAVGVILDSGFNKLAGLVTYQD
ncbi:ABC transporter permease [Nitrospira moscoviensis]|uniref:Nitrate ABC transporter, integral membrane subunit (Modular protein) n=1 Tax=Nitrospira moscoviensis TaxID=42253 RepID=A0A0K2G9T2_NITMO|nr:ABC transporter permease subunit [Nitrospira moscoviensis]ALA57700.1 Nitrate ABC transporter, integral membrane subunit (modular protein) [Nitrospira moscoviensis]